MKNKVLKFGLVIFSIVIAIKIISRLSKETAEYQVDYLMKYSEKLEMLEQAEKNEYYDLRKDRI